MNYQIFNDWLASLNNEQIKHIATAFRILGVGAFLGAIKDVNNLIDTVPLIMAWGILEFMGLSFLKRLKEDK